MSVSRGVGQPCSASFALSANWPSPVTGQDAHHPRVDGESQLALRAKDAEGGTAQPKTDTDCYCILSKVVIRVAGRSWVLSDPRRL
jgi:hypothetical protein